MVSTARNSSYCVWNAVGSAKKPGPSTFQCAKCVSAIRAQESASTWFRLVVSALWFPGGDE